MANRYWVTGGTGLFNSTTNWSATSGGASGASIPGTADVAYFDANSGSGTATVNSSHTLQDMILTGFTGTLSGTVIITLTAGSSFTVSPTMTWNFTGTLRLNQTNSNYILTTNGKTIGGLEIGVNNNVVLGGALTYASNDCIVNGGFDTNNYTVTGFDYFTANPTANVKFNGSTVFTGGGFTISPTSTFDAGTSTISFTLTVPFNAAYFYTGQKTYNKVIVGLPDDALFFYGTTSNPTSSSTYNEIEVLSTNSQVFFFEDIITNTFIASGTSLTTRLQIYGQKQGPYTNGHRGGNITLTVNTWATKQFIDFRDINAAGPLVPWTGTSFGDCQGNTGITFPAPKTVYWNLAGSSYITSNGWALSSGGVPNSANFPLAQDTVVIDNSSSGTLLDLGYYNIKSVVTSARTTPFTIQTNSTIYGNWNTGSGITYNGGRITFSGNLPQTVLTDGKVFPAIYLLSTSTLTLSEPLTSSGSLIVDAGTLITNSFPITTTLLGLGISAPPVREAQFGTSVITVTGSGTVFTSTGGNTNLTISGSPTVIFNNATAVEKTFQGGGTDLSIFTVDQAGPGALLFTGTNTRIGNLTNSYGSTGATSILFTAATTTFFDNWNASGTAGKLLTVKSKTNAVHTLSKSSGTVNAQYLELRYSTATGGATWIATDSVNLGNNTGWNIGGLSSASNFFLLFM